jgi:hypothetical protein
MLKGSEKQVSWAKRIKTERLSIWKKTDPLVFQEVESNLDNELSASWWITYREKSLSEVIPYIVEGGGLPERKATAKPKTTKGSSPVPFEESYTRLEDTRRFIGELKSVVSGELVVDPECPF